MRREFGTNKSAATMMFFFVLITCVVQMGKTTVYRSWVKKTAKNLFQQVNIRKKYIVQKYFLEDTYKRKLQYIYLPRDLADHKSSTC